MVFWCFNRLTFPFRICHVVQWHTHSVGKESGEGYGRFLYRHYGHSFQATRAACRESEPATALGISEAHHCPVLPSDTQPSCTLGTFLVFDEMELPWIDLPIRFFRVRRFPNRLL